jgi:hypothetical protein
MPDQQRVWSRCTSDVLRLGTYDRCNAQLEFLDGFDSAQFLHCSRFVRNIIDAGPILARADFVNTEARKNRARAELLARAPKVEL